MRKCLIYKWFLVLALYEFRRVEQSSYSSSQLEVRVVSVLGTKVPHVGTELVSQPLPLHHLDLLVAVVVAHRPRELLVVHRRVLLLHSPQLSKGSGVDHPELAGRLVLPHDHRGVRLRIPQQLHDPLRDLQRAPLLPLLRNWILAWASVTPWSRVPLWLLFLRELLRFII